MHDSPEPSLLAYTEECSGRVLDLRSKGHYFKAHQWHCAWVKVINPEFRILRLTFHGKSASKC